MVEGQEFLHSWVTMTAAAIGAASSIVSGMQKQSEANRQLEKYGSDMAAVEVNAAIEQDKLISKSAAIQQTKQQHEMQIEMNAHAAEAQAQVAAAASGTAGQSVELTSTEIEANAGRALGSLQAMEDNLLNEAEQMSRDINIQAESAKRNVEVYDTGTGLLDVFTGGLKGYLFGRSA